MSPWRHRGLSLWVIGRQPESPARVESLQKPCSNSNFFGKFPCRLPGEVARKIQTLIGRAPAEVWANKRGFQNPGNRITNRACCSFSVTEQDGHLSSGWGGD